MEHRPKPSWDTFLRLALILIASTTAAAVLGLSYFPALGPLFAFYVFYLHRIGDPESLRRLRFWLLMLIGLTFGFWIYLIYMPASFIGLPIELLLRDQPAWGSTYSGVCLVGSAVVCALLWLTTGSRAVAASVAVAGIAAAIIVVYRDQDGSPIDDRLDQLAVGLWHGLICVSLCWWVVWGARRTESIPQWRVGRAAPSPCPHCGYDLAFLRGGECPQCGSAFHLHLGPDLEAGTSA